MGNDVENLLQETIKVLAAHKLTPKDVVWVGSEDGTYATNWDGFAKIADREYNSGLGGQEVIRDLVVVGEDWWLERHEYDGSEWWEFKQLPKQKPVDELKPLRLIFRNDHEHYVETMEELHEVDEDEDEA